MADRCREGDWVEVERVLLQPDGRSPNLPSETAGKPLMMWVKGFALGDAALGDQVEIETMAGRHVEGKLTTIGPGYTHTFGAPIAELSAVGRDLRARLVEYRAGDGGGAA